MIGQFTRKQKHVAIAAITVWIAVCVVGAMYDQGWFRGPELSAKESAQRALLTEAYKLLADFHAMHGRYPETLRELPFTFPDGGDRSLLDEFNYEPWPYGYRLSVTFAYTGRSSQITHTDEQD